MTTKNKLVLQIFFIIALLGVGSSISAQVDTTEKVYDFVTEMAVYPGGQQQLMKDISRNFEYPTKAIAKGIEGTLMISIVVEKDGSISNIECERSLGYGLDEAGIEAVKKLKNFEAPGKKNGEAVRSYIKIPIRCVPMG